MFCSTSAAHLESGDATMGMFHSRHQNDTVDGVRWHGFDSDFNVLEIRGTEQGTRCSHTMAEILLHNLCHVRLLMLSAMVIFLKLKILPHTHLMADSGFLQGLPGRQHSEVVSHSPSLGAS